MAQAAAAEGAPSGGGGPSGPVAEEEVRGPHASLAVRLQVCSAPAVCLLAPLEQNLMVFTRFDDPLGATSGSVVFWQKVYW